MQNVPMPELMLLLGITDHAVEMVEKRGDDA